MQYNLKGAGLDLSVELRGYLDTKLSGLDDLLSNSGSARTDVELEYKQSEEKRYRAELMLHDGIVVRAEAGGQTLHEAIDKAVQELFEELSRAKKKKRHVFRRGASRVKDFFRGLRSRP